ncbi:MAG: RHS repeat domain-containing protein [Candidatus Bathyarchaeia archaeon]
MSSELITTQPVKTKPGEFVKVVSGQLGIMEPPEGRKITKLEFSYDENGNLSTLKAYEGSELLFTLTLTYDSNQNLVSVTRS